MEQVTGKLETAKTDKDAKEEGSDLSRSKCCLHQVPGYLPAYLFLVALRLAVQVCACV